MTALLMPVLASAQIDPCEPDPHEPPALLVPRQLVWNFTEYSAGYVQPTFAAKQGWAVGAAPMYGKIRLVSDMIGPKPSGGKEGWPVVAGQGRNGTKALLIEGDALRFHADAPFLGSISLWFREPEGPLNQQWRFSVGGVSFGALNHPPYDRYQVGGGLVNYLATNTIRNQQWHHVQWRLRWNNDLLAYPGAHRYIEVYLDGQLVFRHGFTGRLHSLSIEPAPSVNSSILLVDDIVFEDDPNGSAGVTALLRPYEDLGIGGVGGVSTHDFEVVSAANREEAGILLALDVNPQVAQAIHPSPEQRLPPVPVGKQSEGADHQVGSQ